jgi:hypothetical protein
MKKGREDKLSLGKHQPNILGNKQALLEGQVNVHMLSLFLFGNSLRACQR